MKLNFGCGRDIKKGYVNVDIEPLEGVDEVWDLNIFPYPFKDESAEEILCISTLQIVKNVIKVVEEFHRILKPGGLLFINVPHFTGTNLWKDLSHRRGFSYYAFEFFTNDLYYQTHKKFSKMKAKFEFGKKYAIWNYLIEWIANKWPHLYEDTPLRMFPAINLDVELIK